MANENKEILFNLAVFYVFKGEEKHHIRIYKLKKFDIIDMYNGNWDKPWQYIFCEK